MAERACFSQGDLVEIEINRLATQYREAEKLKGLLRNILGGSEESGISLCAVPDFFDLDTAVDDQLTILGKWLGFPRCHCVCGVTPPVAGFDCDGDYEGPYTLVGFCSPGSSWADCPTFGDGDVCLDDDELYRRYLKVRRYQMLGLYDIASLQLGIRHIWGDTASVADTSVGRVILSPGRPLTADEVAEIPIAFRVFPIAPGIKAFLHNGNGPIAGFGAGWSGFCEDAAWLCAADPQTYFCTV
jgi:hypothetical protein